MKKRSKKNLIFRFLLVLYILLLALLCFGNFSNMQMDIARTIFGIPTDKVVHFLMFLPFPVILFLAYDCLTEKPYQSLIFAVATFLIGCILAAATEMIQSRITYRSGDPFDFRADTLALAISSVAVLIIDLSKQFRPRSKKIRVDEKNTSSPKENYSDPSTT